MQIISIGAVEMKILKIIICALDGLFALLFLWLDIEIALKYFNEMPVVNESQLYLLAFSACLLSGIFFLALFVAGIKLAISDKRMRTLTVIMPSVLAVFWFSPFAAVPIAGSICNNSGYERLNYDEPESQRELYSQKIYAIAENNGDNTHAEI